MNWKNIRVYNNSQNNAFEELVCQLARQEKISGYKRFVRNGTPDGGVECFWELEDGRKIAWQAKYVFDIDGVIAEADRSYNNALKSHATMCKFVIAIPFDLPDPNYVKKGKPVKSALKKWEEKVAFWEEKAKKENKSVKVILWNSSELLQRMMKPENEGMRYYWFNNEEFTVTWFHNQLESTINDLGPRYSPELNVQLEINEKFEYLRRSSKVYLSIQRIRKAFIKTGRNYVNEIIKANIYEQQGREKLLRIIESVSEQLKMNEYKEMQLLAFECISDELKKIEDINHEISNVVFSRMSHDFYDSEFYKAYSEFENTIYEIEGLIKGDWCLLNNPVMLVFGDAGTGKSHLLADICKNVLREGNQAILILGDYFISSVNPKEQIKQLFQSNLSYSAILGILNAIGQANGERIIFALDALNEGEGSLIWPKFLRGMITEVKRFPWIGFVMSVRSDNMDEIVPEECKKEMVIVQHTGFEECVDEACDNFFEYYGINFNMPILSEEFCNALYLKLFCETFKKEENITQLPGLTDIFSGYLNHINKKLSGTDRFQYEESLNLVELCVQRVASKMADGNTYSLPYKDVLDEVNDCTFEKAFEGEENLKKISFDCEAGGFFCYSRDFDVLAEYGRRFRDVCMNEQKFTELVCRALSEDRQPVEEEISTEGMTPFFSAVAKLARSKGFKMKGVQGGALTLTLKGEFAVMVDETGAINYHPYNEVFDIMHEVSELKKSIPLEETGPFLSNTWSLSSSFIAQTLIKSVYKCFTSSKNRSALSLIVI